MMDPPSSTPPQEGDDVSAIPHPTDLELARWADGADDSTSERVDGHLRTCQPCKVRAAQADGPLPTADASTIAGLAATSPQLSQQVQHAVTQRRGLEPAAGQLWRLSWRAQTILAVLVDAAPESGGWLVVPVTTDAEWADQYTLIIDEASSPAGAPLALWAALRTTVPTECLDRPLAELGLRKELETAYNAFLDDAPIPNVLPDTMTTGTPIISPADERWEYRETVSERISAMAAVAEELANPALAPDLMQVLEAQGVELADFARVLDLSTETAYDVVMGNAGLPADKIEPAAEVLGVPVDAIALEPRAEPAVLRLLARPDIRDELERRATPIGRPAATLWSEFETHMLKVAARETGVGGQRTERWEKILHAWLDAQG